MKLKVVKETVARYDNQTGVKKESILYWIANDRKIALMTSFTDTDDFEVLTYANLMAASGDLLEAVALFVVQDPEAMSVALNALKKAKGEVND